MPTPPVRVVLTIVALAILGLFLPVDGGPALFALAAMALPAAMLLLGEPGRGPRRLLVAAALVAALALVGGLVLLMAGAGDDPTGRWLLGLPLGLAIQVYVMALLPLLVVGCLFALDFERFRPGRRDIERIRSLADDDT